MNTHRRPPTLGRRVSVPVWLVIAAPVVAILGIGATALAAITPNYNAQCVVTPKSNGGQVLDCDPIAAPSTSPSASPSPSSSPTTAPSPTASPSPSTTPSPSPSTTAPATTPPPSPSPTGTQRNCLANLAACGFPNDLNTGPTGTLTVVNGNVTITASGVYADREIRGCLEVRASNVTVRNVKVVGTCITGNVRTYAAGTQFLDIEVDCRDGSNSHGFNNGPGGFATIRRADIHDCENGLNVPGNTDIQDSWIHNLYDGGGAHTDGAQFNQGASNITFVHNTIDARGNSTSAIIQWDENAPFNSDVLISGNLLAGGAYTLYCSRQGPVTNIRIINNRFGPYTYGSSNSCVGNHVTEWSGNVTDSTGAPLAAA